MPPAVDTFSSNASGLVSPAPNGAAIATSDTVDIANVSRWVYVGGTGDITATMQGGGDVVFKAVPVGTLLPIRVTRVKATGTTATNLVAIY